MASALTPRTLEGGLWVLSASVALLAVGVGLAQGTSAAQSEVPSVDNVGPRGLGVLAAWLEASGTRVVRLGGPLDVLPGGLGTVVLAAPEAREVTPAEVESLRRFVSGGGVLVYLRPRRGLQPALDRWLEVSSAQGPAPSGTAVATEVKVVAPRGPLRGVSSLTVRPQATVELPGLALDEVGALWWRPEGQGDVLVGAGADLAENELLESPGNARLWAALARRGPVAFDEHHHQAPPASGLPHFWPLLLQAALVAGLFVWWRAPRLGPPRRLDEAVERRLSESVAMVARLTQRAGLERPLALELKAQVRADVTARLGLPVELPDAELARALVERGAASALEAHALEGASLLELARLAVRLEGGQRR